MSRLLCSLILLAEVLQAVLATEVGTGLADDAVARRVVIPPVIPVTSTIIRVRPGASVVGASAYDAGAVHSPPRLSTRNASDAHRGQRSTARACALSTDNETPPCSDQPKDSAVVHAKTEATIATLLICFIAFLQSCFAPEY